MINFIDVGAYVGGVVGIMTKLFDALKIEYKIYAFEPNIDNFVVLKQRFENAELINAACADFDGEGNLYKSVAPGGDSLQSTKNNVDKNRFVRVPVMKFSNWFKLNINPNDFNIVKINIEGGEYELYKDIIESGIRNSVDIFCGSLGDIYKIGKSDKEIRDFLNSLEANNIDVITLSVSKQENIPGIVTKIKEYMEPEIIEPPTVVEPVIKSKVAAPTVPKKRGRPKRS